MRVDGAPISGPAGAAVPAQMGFHQADTRLYCGVPIQPGAAGRRVRRQAAYCLRAFDKLADDGGEPFAIAARREQAAARIGHQSACIVTVEADDRRAQRERFDQASRRFLDQVTEHEQVGLGDEPPGLVAFQLAGQSAHIRQIAIGDEARQKLLEAKADVRPSMINDIAAALALIAAARSIHSACVAESGRSLG